MTIIYCQVFIPFLIESALQYIYDWEDFFWGKKAKCIYLPDLLLFLFKKTYAQNKKPDCAGHNPVTWD